MNSTAIVADPDAPSPGSKSDFFHRRELCFTLADDVFVRYKCFRDAEEFAKAVCVQSQMPYKIDIGPVMNYLPSENKQKQGKMECLERELVFDIDMDAYDDIRTCALLPWVSFRCGRGEGGV